MSKVDPCTHCYIYTRNDARFARSFLVLVLALEIRASHSKLALRARNSRFVLETRASCSKFMLRTQNSRFALETHATRSKLALRARYSRLALETHVTRSNARDLLSESVLCLQTVPHSSLSTSSVIASCTLHFLVVVV